MAIKTKLSTKNFEEILSRYDIGDYVSSKHINWALQNTVYEITTSRDRYILKIFEESDVSLINYQLHVIEYLAKKDVPVARVVRLNNHLSMRISGKRMILHRFIEGKKPTKFSAELVRDIAKNLATMDKHLMRLRSKNLWGWEKDHQFKPSSNSNEEKKLLTEMKQINRKTLRKCMIHGDCHGINLLVRGNKLSAILDWDDMHYDYLAQEIGVFIMSMHENHADDLVGVFLNEYNKILEMNKEEQKAIYYFVRKRFLSVMLWHKYQIKKHPGLQIRLHLQLNNLRKTYNKVKRQSLEDFLSLIQ